MATYIGFSTDPKFPSFRVTDFDLVVQDLINHLYTRVGERVMNPKFGCVIWDLLFDPFTDETRATIFDNLAAIIDAEPRVNLTSLSIDEYDQGIAVALDLEYIATGDARSLSLEFDRVSESIYVSGRA